MPNSPQNGATPSQSSFTPVPWSSVSNSQEYLYASPEVRQNKAREWVDTTKRGLSEAGMFDSPDKLIGFEARAAEVTGEDYDPEAKYGALNEALANSLTGKASATASSLADNWNPQVLGSLAASNPGEAVSATALRLARPDIGMSDERFKATLAEVPLSQDERLYLSANRKTFRDAALGAAARDLADDSRLKEWGGIIYKDAENVEGGKAEDAFKWTKVDGKWSPAADTNAITWNPSRGAQEELAGAESLLSSVGPVARMPLALGGAVVGAVKDLFTDKTEEVSTALAEAQQKYGLSDEDMTKVVDLGFKASLPDDVKAFGKLTWDKETGLPSPFVRYTPETGLQMSNDAATAKSGTLEDMISDLPTDEAKEQARALNKLNRMAVYKEVLPDMLNRDAMFADHFKTVAEKPENADKSREEVAMEAVDTYKRGVLRGVTDALHTVSVEGMGDLVASGLGIAGILGSTKAADMAAGITDFTTKEQEVRALLGQGSAGKFTGDLLKLVPQVASLIATSGGAATVGRMGKAASMAGEMQALGKAGQLGGKAVALSLPEARAVAAGTAGAQKAAQQAAWAASIGASGVQSAGLTFASEYRNTLDRLKSQGMEEQAAKEQALSEARVPAIASGLITAAVTALFGKTGVESAFTKGAAERLTLRDLVGTGMDAAALRGSGLAKAAGQALVTFGKGFASEATEEAADEFLGNLTQMATTSPDLTLQQAFEGAVYAGMLGGVAGGTVESGARSSPQVIQDYLVKRGAVKQADTLKTKAAELEASGNPETAAVIQEVASATEPVVTTPLAAQQGVAPVERDVTKPEQMTPAEFGVVAVGERPKPVVSARRRFGPLELKSPSATPEAVAQWNAEKKAIAEWNKQASAATEKSNAYWRALEQAVANQKPVSAEGFESRYIINAPKGHIDAAPEGYTKQGDLYVFQPTPTPTISGQQEAPATTTPEPTTNESPVQESPDQGQRQGRQESLLTPEQARARLRPSEKEGGVDPRVLRIQDDKVYVSERVPLSEIAPNERGDLFDSTTREAVAKEYAARPGEFPPIITTSKKGRNGFLNVLDGGHRVSAARMRGDTEIEIIREARPEELKKDLTVKEGAATSTETGSLTRQNTAAIDSNAATPAGETDGGSRSPQSVSSMPKRTPEESLAMMEKVLGRPMPIVGTGPSTEEAPAPTELPPPPAQAAQPVAQPTAPPKNPLLTDTTDADNQAAMDTVPDVVVKAAFPQGTKAAPKPSAPQRRADIDKAGVKAGKQKVGDLINKAKQHLTPGARKVLEAIAPAMDMNREVNVVFLDGMEQSALYHDGTVALNRDAQSRANGILGDLVHELIHDQLKNIAANPTPAQKAVLDKIEKLRKQLGEYAKAEYGRANIGAPRDQAEAVLAEAAAGLSYAFGVPVDEGMADTAAQSNIEEFFTLAFQDPAVQMVMKKADRSGKVPNAWQRFKASVMRLFGVNLNTGSAMDTALDSFISLVAGEQSYRGTGVPQAAPQGIQQTDENLRENRARFDEEIQAVPTPAWGDSDSQKLDALESFGLQYLGRFRDRLAALGVPIRSTADGYGASRPASAGTPTVASQGDGSIWIGFVPREVASRLLENDRVAGVSTSELVSKRNIAHLVEEEVIHALHLLKVRDAWDGKGSFNTFQDNYFNEFLKDTEQSLGVEETRKILADSQTIYRNGTPVSPDAFDGNPRLVASAFKEIVRATVQMRARGDISEAKVLRWLSLVGEKIQTMLDALRDIARNPQSFGQRMADEANMVADEFEKLLADTKTVTGAPKASPQGITPAQDAEYMAAVEAGDMAKAQRMVDEAARAQGYDKQVFHGTVEKKPTKLRQSLEARTGIFTTDNPDVAEIFRYEREYGNVINEVFNEETGEYEPVEPGALLTLYARLGKVADLSKSKVNPQEFVMDTGLQARALAAAKQQGYNTVKVPDVMEGVGDMMQPGTTYVLFDSSQLKSADPVTYDSAGNPIPLSERFNPVSPDIRYAQQGIDFKDTTRNLALGTTNELTVAKSNIEKWLGEVFGTSVTGKLAKNVRLILGETKRMVGAAEGDVRKRKANLTKLLAKYGPEVSADVDQFLGSTGLGLTDEQAARIEETTAEARKAIETQEGLKVKERKQALEDLEVGRQRMLEHAATVNHTAFMQRQAAAMTRLKAVDPELARQVKELRATVDAASARLRSMLPAQHPLTIVFGENMGMYLHRSYAYFADPEARRAFFGIDTPLPMTETARAIKARAARALCPVVHERLVQQTMKEMRDQQRNQLAQEMVEGGGWFDSPDGVFAAAVEELPVVQRELRKQIRELAKEMRAEAGEGTDVPLDLAAAKQLLMELEPDLLWPTGREEAEEMVARMPDEMVNNIVETEIHRLLSRSTTESLAGLKDDSDSIFKKRKDIPDWLADLWGMNTNTVDSVLETAMLQAQAEARWKSKQHILEMLEREGLAMQQRPDRPWLADQFDVTARPGDLNVRIAGRSGAGVPGPRGSQFRNESVVTLSSLDKSPFSPWSNQTWTSEGTRAQGQEWVVPRSVAEAIREYVDTDSNKPSGLYRALLILTRYSMMTKTTGSAKSLPRNLLGNLWQQAVAGTLSPESLKRLPKAFQYAAADLAADLEDIQDKDVLKTDPTVWLFNKLAKRVDEGVKDPAEREKMIKYMREAMEYGVAGATFFPELLKDLEKLSAATSNATTQGALGGVKKTIDRWMKTRASIYQAMDIPFRIMAFEHNLAKQMQYRGITDRDSDAPEMVEAKKAASKVLLGSLPTYNEGGVVAQMLRKSIFFAPFVSYSVARFANNIYLAKRWLAMTRVQVRTDFLDENNVEQGPFKLYLPKLKKDARETTDVSEALDFEELGIPTTEFATREEAEKVAAMVRKDGVKAMAAQVGWQTALIAAHTVAAQFIAALLPGDDDELPDDTALRSLLPDYAKNNLVFFVGTEKDRAGKVQAVKYVDLTYLAGDDILMSAALRAAMNEYAATGKASEAFVAALKQEASPFVSPQLFTSAVLEGISGRDESGKEIYSSADSDFEKMMRGVTHVTKDALLPADVKFWETFFFKALPGEESRGIKYDPVTEAVALISGTKIRRQNITRALENSTRRVAAEYIAPARNGLSSDLKVDESLDEGDIKAIYARRNAQFQRGMRELSHLLKVADALGQSRSVILAQADASGIRSDIVAAAARNKPMPVPVSQMTMDEVNRIARKRKQPERAEYIRDAVVEARKELEEEAR